ncbi:tRNA (adenosine(37)-N6)-dimethylallyltransferase MiaA [bacterium]|nr:tRNA (adenosine(37)-N6)-dimethylallyltransferase MiaA [bacterium]
MKKLIVILGPTASGKTKLAVKLAKKFKGEIISADSRQVYKEMDIGTDKITKREMQGVPHYLLDVASPKRRFTVAQYRKLAMEAINKIFKKKKIPILCGGTGFYIKAVIDGIILPKVKPDWKLRKELEKKTTEELFNELKKLDPQRAKTIEPKNKRRLIRALEIVKKIGRVPILKKHPLPYPVLMIGIKKERKELNSLIRKRFFRWLKKGVIREVKNLKRSGLSWQRIEDFGLHYRVISQYLQGKINRKEMIEKSIKEIQKYAKGQMNWWKSDKRIHWIKNQREAEKLVKEFLNKKALQK